MSLHIKKPNRKQRAESNILNTKIAKPKKSFKVKKDNPYKVHHYANMRIDAKVVAEVGILRDLFHYSNKNETVARLIQLKLNKMNPKQIQEFKVAVKFEMQKYLNK